MTQEDYEKKIEELKKELRESFSLGSKEQREKVRRWELNHRCIYRRKKGEYPYAGAAGGAFTYSFTPTGLGTIYRVTCMCGKKFEYDDLN